MRKKTVDTIPTLSDTIKAILINPLASQGMPNQSIASQAGLHYSHVATWRNRFLAAQSSLGNIETCAPGKLEKESRVLLSDKKRSGAPSKFTPEQIAGFCRLFFTKFAPSPFLRRYPLLSFYTLRVIIIVRSFRWKQVF